MILEVQALVRLPSSYPSTCFNTSHTSAASHTSTYQDDTPVPCTLVTVHITPLEVKCCRETPLRGPYCCCQQQNSDGLDLTLSQAELSSVELGAASLAASPAPVPVAGLSLWAMNIEGQNANGTARDRRPEAEAEEVPEESSALHDQLRTTTKQNHTQHSPTQAQHDSIRPL